MTADKLTLRVAEPSDIGALDHLFQRSYMQLLAQDYPPSVLVTAIPLIAKAQPALVSSGRFYVVEREGVIAGAGGWSLQAPGGRAGMRGVGHIRHIATDPDHLRQGVARRLMQHITLCARGCGMAQLHCQSTRTAVPFYSAMGFVAQADIVVDLRPGITFPAVFMVAQL